jgi:hypothetical protein
MTDREEVPMSDYARKHTSSITSQSDYSNSSDLDVESQHNAEDLNAPLLGTDPPHKGKRASFAESSNTTTYIPKRAVEASFGDLGYTTADAHDTHDHVDPHDDGLGEFLPPPPESLDFDMWESRVNLVYNIELLKRGHLNSILKVRLALECDVRRPSLHMSLQSD